MKIVCIYAGVSYYQQKLDYIFNVFRETLGELGVSITMVNVTQITLPYFEGRKNNTIQNITDSIKTSQAVIFATTAQKLSVCGAMQVFLEHLDYSLYGEILKNKPCISIVTSMDNSECMAGNYLSSVLGNLEVISSNNMLVGEQYLHNIESSQEIKQMIEKYAEDFYRVIKQNRQFFIAKPFKTAGNSNNIGGNFGGNLGGNISNNNLGSSNNNLGGNFGGSLEVSNNNNQASSMLNTNDFKTANVNINNNNNNNNIYNKNVADLYKKETEKDNFNTSTNLGNNNFVNNNNAFGNSFANNNNNNNNSVSNSFSQVSLTDNNNTNYNNNYNSNNNNNYSNNNYSSGVSSDIPQIAQNIQEQYQSSEKGMISQYLDSPDSTQVIPQNIDMPVHKGTLKQKTQSLYHYFQPQISQGLDISMQVMVTGAENFNGYFLIKNSECVYIEGLHNNASVYIMSDASVWEEILVGKCTLQKAFMLGRLKVKGNFVIISRFEQFFKII